MLAGGRHRAAGIGERVGRPSRRRTGRLVISAGPPLAGGEHDAGAGAQRGGHAEGGAPALVELHGGAVAGAT